MKIAVLYICTGKYSIFWNEFYQSAKQNFLNGFVVDYYVFTDADLHSTDKNIKFIYQKKYGWPMDTLLRYHMFYRIRKDLINYDYIFFLNANSYINEPVGFEILPQDKGLVGFIHYAFYDYTNENFTYERRKESMAYIKPGLGTHYYMGGINGGKAKDYLKLIEKLAYQIEIDLHNGIVAIWHDESHLNKYFIDNEDNLLSLSCEYGSAEGAKIPFSQRIIFRNKNNHGGLEYLRS